MSTTPTLEPPVRWHPAAEEVKAILDSMRPIIQRFADRDRRLLAQWAERA